MANNKSPFGRNGMFKSASHLHFRNAANLRKEPTYAEEMLWQKLKGKALGVKFRRQHPIGRFILDVYCHSCKLAIEVDGSIHRLPEIQQQDLEKNTFLSEEGINLLRFSNKEVFQDCQRVVEIIRKQIISQ